MDDDSIRTPEEMLALVRDQQRSISGQKGAYVPLILLAWGIAWLIGFGALWLIDRPGMLSLPIEVAAPIFVVLLAGAGVLSTVLGIRSARGFRTGKEDAFVGIVYGQLWWVGCIAIFVLGEALVANGMDRALLGLFYPSVYILFVGIMFVVSAAIWRAIPMLILGGWSIVLSAVAPFAGQPDHFLVFALAGGGGFLAAAVWTAIWVGLARRRLAGGQGE